MLKIKKNFSFQPQKDSEDQSVEDLLVDLEMAMKKHEKSQENSIGLLQSFEKSPIIIKNTEEEEEEEEEYDQDLVLKEIEFCETEEDMKELLSNEEIKLIFSNENSYKLLYQKALKKSFIMIKIIKNYLNSHKTELFASLNQKCMELTRSLDAQIHENLLLQREKKDLKAKNREQLRCIEEIASELKLYKADPKTISNLDFETIVNLENGFKESLKHIGIYKTNVIPSFFVFFH